MGDSQGAGAVAVLQLKSPLPRLVVLWELVSLLAMLQHVVPVRLAHVQSPRTRLCVYIMSLEAFNFTAKFEKHNFAEEAKVYQKRNFGVGTSDN
jgi:hypothetical protein